MKNKKQYAVLIVGIFACISGFGTFAAALTLKEHLAGRILIQKESRGELWYVNPVDQKRYPLGNQTQALQVLRALAIGVSNADIKKIPVQSVNLTNPALPILPVKQTSQPISYQPLPKPVFKFIVYADDFGATTTTETGVPTQIVVQRDKMIEIVYQVSKDAKHGIDFLDTSGTYSGVIKPGESKSYFTRTNRSRTIIVEYPDHIKRYPYSLGISIY